MVQEKKNEENLLEEGKRPEDMTAEELKEAIRNRKETPVKPEPELKKEQDNKDEQGKQEKKQEAKKETEQKEQEKQETLIAGKFKTNEELIKAYQEAEKKISQQGEESSRLRKQSEQYKEHLSQIYDFDEQGNLIGTKVRPTQQMQNQVDQLASLRPYFPDYTDEQLMAHMGLNALMINAAMKQFEERVEGRLKTVDEIRFEKKIEKQKKDVREKYGEEYAEYESELNEQLSKLSPELQAKEGSIEAALLMVVGSHQGELKEKLKERIKKEVLEEIKSREEKKEDAFVESEGKTSAPAAPPKSLERMSSEEIKKEILKQQRLKK